jgi:Glycosyl transferase family 2
VLEVLLARARRRNPPPPPWRRRAILRWQSHEPAPAAHTAARRGRPLLYGVSAVWNEDDVVYATVRNLFEQGADRVFVIDDASDDETVPEAVAAGAEVVRQPSDGVYSEVRRAGRIQQLVHDRTQAADGEVWWIVADGDEFPRGSDGRTIRDVVEELEPWVDVVGSRVLEHFPAAAERYRRREHPLPAIPLARWYVNPYCRRGHWKHQLLRVRRPGDLFPMPGHHTVGTADGRAAREAEATLLMHHFPLRNRERTEQKLRRSAAPSGRYAASPDTFTRWRIAQRLQALDDVYAGRWQLVPSGFPGERRIGVDLRDWRELVRPEERRLPAGA